MFRRGWLFYLVEDSDGNSPSSDIFGAPNKQYHDIEFFHVQFRSKKREADASEEYEVDVAPDPKVPILLKLTEEEKEQRREIYEAKQKLAEECDLD